jgi:type VI secretion system protein ImpK
MHAYDRFIDLFLFVTEALGEMEVTQPPYQQMREKIVKLIGNSRLDEFAADDVTNARFAVCAWVDEQIARSGWEHKDLWLREQLQRTYFNTTDAGEEFFLRLERLGPHQREVREVYYLCLALGFTGKFCNPGDEFHLEQLKLANLKLLVGDGEGIRPLEGSPLCPGCQALPDAGLSGSRRLSYFSWVRASSLLGPILLFAILFVLYRFMLSSVGDNFLKRAAN